MPDSALSNLLISKKKFKNLLFDKLSIKSNKALLGIILEKNLSKEDEKTLFNLLDGLRNADFEVVILGNEKFKKNSYLLPYTKNNRKILLEAADMALSFSFNDVEEMLLHGTIPISDERPEIKDYNPNKEVGNSFVYTVNNQWCIFAALIRALETFKFPYDWKNIIRQGLESVLVET